MRLSYDKAFIEKKMAGGMEIMGAACMKMKDRIMIKVGQVWREVDKRVDGRLVEVVEFHDTGLPRNVKIKSLATQRHTWASESRFNGKTSGYELFKDVVGE
ncbi:hypothetical protein CYR55_22905 [Chimaeribacter californicus]|uniref:Uncharacterized protein n=1 Tax=Chimaeribacter californicus TaxID=2060067 RepID=A0A2N5DSS4_9GAMM|nr:hypothetical protein [Chimaeribacter californicus]PLR29226.1 hypothetical protein CYR55_22905 [Chimaeribacter californicus]